MSVSGGEVGSSGKIFGRSRGNEMVPAVASELAATKNAVIVIRLADTCQRTPTARRPSIGQKSPIMVHALRSGAFLLPADIEHELKSLSGRYGSLVPDHQTCGT